MTTPQVIYRCSVCLKLLRGPKGLGGECPLCDTGTLYEVDANGDELRDHEEARS